MGIRIGPPWMKRTYSQGAGIIMYLWNTKALAKELRDGTVTERERMKYFLLFMTLIVVGSDNLFSHPEPISVARIILSAISVIATVVGTYGAYRINRAGDDRDFIARAICLSIPLTIRIIAVVLGVCVAGELSILIIGEAAPESPEVRTGWGTIVIVLIVEVLYYWRLWHHIACVSRPQPPPDTIAGVSPRKFGCWLAGIGVALFLCVAMMIGVAAALLFGRGINKSREGNWDEAITQFTRVIQLSPRHAAAYRERGVAFVGKDDCDKAIADFDKAIELDPKNARVYCERGIARSLKDQNDPAIVDFDKAIALDPKCARAYYCRAIAYSNKDGNDQVIADCTRAIELDPRYGHAYCSRGIARCEKGDYDEAIADLDKAIELGPKDVRAYHWRGLVYSYKDDFDKAMADFDKAIELDPKNALAYYWRGLTCSRKGDDAQAIADCTRAIELDPKDGRGSYYRACACYAQRRWSDAQADFRRSCEWVGSKMRDYARLMLWVVGSQLGEKEAADKELAAYFGKYSNAADPWPARIADFLLGKTREGDLMAAAASPDARKEQGRRTEGWYYAGMKRLLAGDKTGAADCFRKCLAIGRKEYSEYYCAQAELKAIGLQGG